MDKKRLWAILFCLATTVCLMASEVVINKEDCTITKEGKTYKLYGKVKIVDAFEDIKVKIVDSFEDADIKIVDAFENSCGKVKIVDAIWKSKCNFASCDGCAGGCRYNFPCEK